MSTEKYTRTAKGVQWIAADSTDLAAIVVGDNEIGCYAYQIDTRTLQLAFMAGSGASIWTAVASVLELFKVSQTASAVNEFTIANAATGNGPTLSATGGDANVGINVVTKGTGATTFKAGTLETLILTTVASAVNEITIINAATGVNPKITCTGEANTGITFENSEAEEMLILDSVASSVNEITIKSAATGNKPRICATGEADTGIILENDQSEEILILASAATSVNEVTVTSAATNVAPSIAATGGDTNISLKLLAKGTGVIDASTDGIRSYQAVTNVHDTTPTKTELETAFGTAATCGRGFIGTVDDNDADTIGYICWCSDANWYFIIGTKAT